MPNEQQALPRIPRILFWDIETAPMLFWGWRTGKQYVAHTQIKKGQRTGIICICYKWAHESKVHSLHWGLDADSSEKMIEEFSRVVASADISIGHNSDRFDIRHVNTQRLINGQGPISWPTSEDTLKQFRKHFYLPSYSLDYISTMLTGSGKDRMEFRDWIDIVEDKDPNALRKMIRYCKKDVLKLEAIYNDAQPFFKPKVHIGVITEGNRDLCPRCGSSILCNDGYSYRPAGKYKRFKCKDCEYKGTDTRKCR